MKRARTKPALVRLPRPEPSQSLLSLLESLEKQALNGDLEAFGFVAVRRQGETQMAWHAPDNTPIALIGEMEILKMRLYDLMKGAL